MLDADATKFVVDGTNVIVDMANTIHRIFHTGEISTCTEDECENARNTVRHAKVLLEDPEATLDTTEALDSILRGVLVGISDVD